MIAHEMPDFLALLMNPSDAPAPVQLTRRTRAPHYYRCRACCEVFTTETRFALAHEARCACGGKGCEYLGESKAGSLAREELRSACDARCTDALGPNCDCLCGGINHGTGKLVTVEILQGIPHIRLLDPATARARREEFETEQAEVDRRLFLQWGAHVSNYRAAQWIDDRTAWLSIRRAQEAVIHARRLKLHRNRIAALRKIQP